MSGRVSDSEEEVAPSEEQPLEQQATEGARDRDELVQRAELIISNVLRGGVLLSAAIITAGVVDFYREYLASYGSAPLYQDYPHTLGQVITDLEQGNPLAIITLGLLVLLATPVVRVAVSIVAFGLERDWRYVVITSCVLLIIVVSFVLGAGGA